MTINWNDRLLQDIQAKVMQEFFKIQMSAAFGDAWIATVAQLVQYKYTANDRHKSNYVGIKNILDKEGFENLDETRMDITSIGALIEFDFLAECEVGTNFREHIRNIKNDKNELFSHITRLTDEYSVNELRYRTLKNLRDFLNYLANSNWHYPNKTVFVNKYLKKLKALNEEKPENALKELPFSELKQMAEENIPEAQLEMAIRLYNGLAEDGEYDDKRVTELFEKAADAGNAEAMARLAHKMLANPYVTEQEIERAYSLLAEAKEKNCPYARYVYGRIAELGLAGETPNKEKAYRKYDKSAEQGCIPAKIRKAYCKAMGIGTEKDERQGVASMRAIAKNTQNPLAYYLLGIYYHKQNPPMYKEAFKCFEDVAEIGYSDAEYQLGLHYCYGLGIKRDYDKAIDYFEKSAEKGLSSAIRMLGICYCYGYGVNIDYDKAVDYFKEAMKKGCLDAIIDYGDCYYYGKGVSKNSNQAYKLYMAAKNRGNDYAEYCLGKCYYYGEGTKKNYDEAFRCFKKTADKGFNSSIAMLGECYYYGRGTEKDYDQAFRCFKKVADKGFNSSIAMLGECYYYGRGTEKDYDQAFRCFKEAADEGSNSSIAMLGQCYYYGRGTEKDYDQAFRYFKKAADNGDKRVYYILGICYRHGIGTEINVNEAFNLFIKAANDQDKRAYASLGECYAEGLGTDKNYDLAIKYYQKAILAGDTNSKQQLISCLNEKKKQIS